MKGALGALAIALVLTGWLVRGQLGGVEAAVPVQDPKLLSAFGSLDMCRSALAAGQRVNRAAGRARFGSWNLHWFPDGRPGRGGKPGGTDLDWLACAIVWLSVDVLAVQEVKDHAGARQKTRELIDKLDALSSGRWRLLLDDCPADAGQHVGFLFDEARVNVRHAQTFGALNPHGEACKDQLRPGFGAYFRFPGGLDLHAVSVHLKSGTERRALELRGRSLARLKDVYAAAQGSEPDGDVLFLGDFNTMGCGHCSPKVSPAEELAVLASTIRPANLRQVPASASCSHYFSGRGTLLDLAVISSATRELAAATRVEVSGICGALKCQKLASAEPRPEAFTALSDHCPILLDLSDRDLD